MLLVEGDERHDIEKYMEEEEVKHVETLIRIRDYLKSRQEKDAFDSVADHETEAVAESNASARPLSSKEAEIRARLKELRLCRQLAARRTKERTRFSQSEKIGSKR